MYNKSDDMFGIILIVSKHIDIKDYKNYCSIDKITRLIFGDPRFWRDIFDRFNILMFNVTDDELCNTNTGEWLYRLYNGYKVRQESKHIIKNILKPQGAINITTDLSGIIFLLIKKIYNGDISLAEITIDDVICTPIVFEVNNILIIKKDKEYWLYVRYDDIYYKHYWIFAGYELLRLISYILYYKFLKEVQPTIIPKKSQLKKYTLEEIICHDYTLEWENMKEEANKLNIMYDSYY